MLYGNVTNTTRTHFQFDKIYPNRYSMEYIGATGRDLDDVYIAPGRFVLVSYAYDVTSDSDFLFGYNNYFDQTANGITGTNGALYIDATCIVPFKYTEYTLVPEGTANADNIKQYYVLREGGYFKAPYYIATETYYTQTIPAGEGAVTLGQIIRRRCNNTLDGEMTGQGDIIINPNPQGYAEDFFVCTGQSAGNAVFEPLNLADIDSGYFHNYYIDKEHYFDSDDTWGTLHRGYDNTVWQKVVTAEQERYVLVAHLNALAPGLNVVAEPPTAEPVAPFLGADSTDLLYQLHIQSPWGLDLKTFSATDNPDTLPSDITVQKTSFLFDDSTQTETTSTTEVPAGIYWNNDGMDPHKEVMSTNADKATEGSNNFIRMDTSASTNFNERYPNKVLSSNADMKTLQIYLPGIGDMAATGWNLIYGQPPEGSVERRMDTEWYQKNSGFKENGDPAKQFKTYDLNCLAGCINTYHKRLGQIIQNISTLPSAAEVNALWDDDTLYYNTTDNKYYRKGIDFVWTQVDYQYEPITLNQYTYTPYTYYFLDDGTYNEGYDYAREGVSGVSLVGGGTVDLIGDFLGEFDATKQYYCRKISAATPAYYIPIDLTQFESERYYFKQGNDYFRDNTTMIMHPNLNYLDITLSEKYTFSQSYATRKFYLYDETHHTYTLDEGPYSPTATYYLYQTSQQAYTGFPYAPGIYYRQELSNEGYEGIDQFQTADDYWWILDDNPTPTLNRLYMLPSFMESSQYVYWVDEFGNKHMVKGYELDLNNSIYISYPSNYDANAEYYYYENGTYSLVDTDFLAEQDESFFRTQHSYYLLSMHPIGDDEKIYIAGEYYRKNTTNGNLYFAEETEYSTNEEDEYYRIVNIQVLPKFFSGGVYYTKNGDQYSIDPGGGPYAMIMQPVQHYEKAGVYVIYDLTGQCPASYEWSHLAEVIPWPFTLKTRTSTYGPIEVKGVDNGDSSINGQILKLSNLIDFGNEDTRDVHTVQGGLNALQDAIYTLGNLKPGYMLYANDYGRITYTNLTYAQLCQKLDNLESRLEALESTP